MRDLPAGLPRRPRSEVRCRTCGITVLVGKTSWQQTSVQWPGDAVSTCPELRAAAGDESLDARLRGCTALRRSIDKAVLGGAIDIPE
ncbi:MAG TPA: hypothetical protein VFU35_14915 [Jatrophihabitans sp.]|nr:hypothetical protein [Jatrophihabitans sp.]